MAKYEADVNISAGGLIYIFEVPAWEAYALLDLVDRQIKTGELATLRGIPAGVIGVLDNPTAPVVLTITDLNQIVLETRFTRSDADPEFIQSRLAEHLKELDKFGWVKIAVPR